MALPTSYGYEAQITDTQDQLGGLSRLYNLRRKRLAANTAAGYADQGYGYDATTSATTDGGNDLYTVAGQGEGRLAHDARFGATADYNSRGLYGSSFMQNDMARRLQEVARAREAYLRGFGDQQAALVDEQGGRVQDLSGRLSGLRGEYADWRAQQPADMPPAPTIAPEVSAPWQAPKPPVSAGQARALTAGAGIGQLNYTKPPAAKAIAGRVRY